MKKPTAMSIQQQQPAPPVWPAVTSAACAQWRAQRAQIWVLGELGTGRGSDIKRAGLR